MFYCCGCLFVLRHGNYVGWWLGCYCLTLTELKSGHEICHFILFKIIFYSFLKKDKDFLKIANYYSFNLFGHLKAHKIIPLRLQVFSHTHSSGLVLWFISCLMWRCFGGQSCFSSCGHRPPCWSQQPGAATAEGNHFQVRVDVFNMCHITTWMN